MKANCWILESADGKLAPGTCKLVEREALQDISGNLSDSKRADTTVLDPVPSEDPNDPLNWPLWQRDLALAILCFAIFVTIPGSGVLGPSFVALSTEFKRDFGDIAKLSAYWQLGVGLSSAILIPFARIWGTRHQYLLGLLLVLSGYTGSGQSKSYNNFLGSQVIQGVGTACYEVLIGISIRDTYFVHQRGSRLAITGVTAYAAGFVSPVLSGIVIENLGWRWLYNILAIMASLAVILMFIFVPETTYTRRSPNSHGTRTSANGSTDSGNHDFASHLNVSAAERFSLRRMSFKRRMLPIQKRVSNGNVIMFWVRPFILVLHPAILWLLISTGTNVFSMVFIGIVIATLFVEPPLNFTPSQIGLMNFALCIGLVIGFIFCTTLLDRSAKLLAKRNDGIYEPEFRLILTIPQLIIGFVGLYGFGVTANDHERYGWLWPAVFSALQMTSVIIGMTTGSVYIIDGYSHIALEGFITITILKAFLAYGTIGNAVRWVETTGTHRLFTILAFVQLGITLTTIPLYVFGKRIRLRFSTISIFIAAESGASSSSSV